jgi:hypothetical protein
MIVAQLVKEFPNFYGTKRFTVVFTTASRNDVFSFCQNWYEHLATAPEVTVEWLAHLLCTREVPLSNIGAGDRIS